MKSFSKIFLTLAVLAPAKLFACAACYANGANINDPMADGMNWAILTLGVVVVTVLGAFLAFLIRAIRKSEALEAAAQARTAQSGTAGRQPAPARPVDPSDVGYAAPLPSKL